MKILASMDGDFKVPSCYEDYVIPRYSSYNEAEKKLARTNKTLIDILKADNIYNTRYGLWEVPDDSCDINVEQILGKEYGSHMEVVLYLDSLKDSWFQAEFLGTLYQIRKDELNDR